MKKITIKLSSVKQRDPIARDLLTAKYHQRVVPNKKRAQKLDRNLSRKQADLLTY
jgi:hypothetical protein